MSFTIKFRLGYTYIDNEQIKTIIDSFHLLQSIFTLKYNSPAPALFE